MNPATKSSSEKDIKQGNQDRLLPTYLYRRKHYVCTLNNGGDSMTVTSEVDEHLVTECDTQEDSSDSSNGQSSLLLGKSSDTANIEKGSNASPNKFTVKAFISRSVESTDSEHQQMVDLHLDLDISDSDDECEAHGQVSAVFDSFRSSSDDSSQSEDGDVEYGTETRSKKPLVTVRKSENWKEPLLKETECSEEALMTLRQDIDSIEPQLEEGQNSHEIYKTVGCGQSSSFNNNSGHNITGKEIFDLEKNIHDAEFVEAVIHSLKSVVTSDIEQDSCSFRRKCKSVIRSMRQELAGAAGDANLLINNVRNLQQKKQPKLQQDYESMQYGGMRLEIESGESEDGNGTVSEESDVDMRGEGECMDYWSSICDRFSSHGVKEANAYDDEIETEDEKVHLENDEECQKDEVSSPSYDGGEIAEDWDVPNELKVHAFRTVKEKKISNKQFLKENKCSKRVVSLKKNTNSKKQLFEKKRPKNAIRMKKGNTNSKKNLLRNKKCTKEAAWLKGENPHSNKEVLGRKKYTKDALWLKRENPHSNEQFLGKQPCLKGALGIQRKKRNANEQSLEKILSSNYDSKITKENQSSKEISLKEESSSKVALWLKRNSKYAKEQLLIEKRYFMYAPRIKRENKNSKMLLMSELHKFRKDKCLQKSSFIKTESKSSMIQNSRSMKLPMLPKIECLKFPQSKKSDDSSYKLKTIFIRQPKKMEDLRSTSSEDDERCDLHKKTLDTDFLSPCVRSLTSHVEPKPKLVSCSYRTKRKVVAIVLNYVRRIAIQRQLSRTTGSVQAQNNKINTNSPVLTGFTESEEEYIDCGGVKCIDLRTKSNHTIHYECKLENPDANYKDNEKSDDQKIELESASEGEDDKKVSRHCDMEDMILWKDNYIDLLRFMDSESKVIDITPNSE